LMDFFRFPSFQPEQLDDKSLFLFLHLWSITDFVNYPNWSKPVSLPGLLSGHRLWQFASQIYAFDYLRLGSLWEVGHIEIGGGPRIFWTSCIHTSMWFFGVPMIFHHVKFFDCMRFSVAQPGLPARSDFVSERNPCFAKVF
jgi:hypothetical protein